MVSPSLLDLLQIRKYLRTVPYLGQSLGKARHWHPVLTIYNDALNTSYKSNSLGFVLFRTDSDSGRIFLSCSRYHITWIAHPHTLLQIGDCF